MLLLLAACGPGEDASVRPVPANRKPNYFDVKGFLDKQVADLNRRQPVVEKQVRLRDGKTETTRVTKTDWAKELQIFYQADINKPALRGAYEVKAVTQSATTGQLYQRKVGVDATVRELLITRATNYPEAMSATIIQDNPLFYSEKKLSLRADARGVKSYSVEGIQKLVLFDTVRYTVRTRIVE
ncbi:hypothetical protein MTX78_21915 [Hymenobacter tibetensis]|uniref:LPS export ABC transporter periplasmic protein LptC n=1 Tax=Hymenobacter tibetensis TaxID=497967 RepID=A0ABY4CZZ2_9BACT|nr:hypothetical protein [Hymenobacter tibetensis]UOG74760.1 hypothetical protein MTX78_21915 [Hymenobacter tibetensis]